MVDYSSAPDGSGVGIPVSNFVNVAAAAVSLALIGGVGVWGYKLLVRDVTGVPVVRALGGEMRVSPENPGGEIASHTGLSVNTVLADGGAAEPEDRLILAPSSVNLQAEDMEMNDADVLAEAGAEAGEVTPDAQSDIEAAVAATLTEADEDGPAIAGVELDPDVPLTAEGILALADQIAAGVDPLEDLAEGVDVPVQVAVNGVAVNPNVIPDAVPGVRLSLRPNVRPAGAARALTVVPTSATTTSTASAEVTTEAIPVGTNLVQLGAFDTPDIASDEWVRLTLRFPDFFNGKNQLIQEASSGGRTFYRLRAAGFDDLNDARRFCAALSADGADCIPVVVR